MAILDGQNVLSNLANGDVPTGSVADIASANVIDQDPAKGLFTGAGGAYVAPWIMVICNATATSGGSATVQAVLQDSPDNVTWTDRLIGTSIAVASVTAGKILMAARMPSTLARYVRVIYRIGTAALTAGTFISFLVLDTDIVDLFLRKADPNTFTEPTNALDESVNQGVLAQ